MDLSDPHDLGLFLEVYGSLPRAAPGGDEHTERALALLPGDGPEKVADLGCGPGAQTIALARSLPSARIVAVDLLPAMAREAQRRIRAAALEHRACAAVGDMARPPLPAGCVDLVWCEAAIYSVGVTAALDAWRPLLSEGGVVVFSEPVWSVDDPAEEVLAWWRSEYPDISGDDGVRARVDAAGYETTGSFSMPPSAWWDEYYDPMLERVASLSARHPDDPVAAEVVAVAEAEIDMFRRFSSQYGYAFFVVRPST